MLIQNYIVVYEPEDKSKFDLEVRFQGHVQFLRNTCYMLSLILRKKPETFSLTVFVIN